MKTYPQHNYLTYLLAGGLLLGAVLPASAIITAGSTRASEDEQSLQATARLEFGAQPTFPYFRNLGALGRSSGIYMGNGFVLTAGHVGAQSFRLYDDSVYEPVAGSEWTVRNPDHTASDLLIFRIAYGPNDTVARLPKIPLGPIAPPPGSRVLMLGAGAGATAVGATFTWDDNYVQRWGLNRVEHQFTSMIESAGFRTPGFSTRFDGPGECQAAPGDSGGAAFVFNEKANRWELGGVVIAVDSKKGRVAFGDQTYIGSLQSIPKNAFQRRLIAVANR